LSVCGGSQRFRRQPLCRISASFRAKSMSEGLRRPASVKDGCSAIVFRDESLMMSCAREASDALRSTDRGGPAGFSLRSLVSSSCVSSHRTFHERDLDVFDISQVRPMRSESIAKSEVDAESLIYRNSAAYRYRVRQVARIARSSGGEHQASDPPQPSPRHNTTNMGARRGAGSD
jgi:hypothetical protein